MPETRRQKLTRLRRERDARRKTNAAARKRRDALNKRIGAVDRRIRALNAGIKKVREALTTSPGERAVNYLLKYEGKSEQPPGSNNAPFLVDWENRLPHNRLDWMIPGQPWCGFAVLAAWYYGAGKLLPDGVVYTPNIVNWANQGQSFTRVNPYSAKKGDLVVFDFDGGGADHVGLALGPAHNGSISTVDGNSSVAGSQSNGGAVVRRTRPLSQVAAVARPK